MSEQRDNYNPVRMRQEAHDELDRLLDSNEVVDRLRYPLVFTVIVEAPVIGALWQQKGDSK